MKQGRLGYILISQSLSNIVEEKRSALESIRKEKMQGHIVRSRTRWVEEGEKPTKYFCNLESRNYINKTIKGVDDGHYTVHEQFEILNQVKSFYEALYLDKDAELIGIKITELTVDDGHYTFHEQFEILNL